VQHSRSTTRRRSRAPRLRAARPVPARPVTVRIVTAAGALLIGAGVLAPSTAAADPGTAAEAMEQVRQAAQELAVVDEQVHQAQILVAEQRAAADAAALAATTAQAAVAAYEPQLRAIATSGYTGENQSRVAAFLTSESATELVQQMTTLDMIAAHTNEVIFEVAVLQAAAEEAQAVADEAAAVADAGLAELQAQQAEVQARIAEYEADFARLTAEEQAAVTTAVAGPALAAPSVAELPVDPGSAVATVIATALAQVGTPYVWGGSSPGGFDCSGLTSYAFASVGVQLPHSSRAQAGYGQQVSRGELQPGDLVFYGNPIYHVAIYIGGGQIVHARTFGQPLSVTSVDIGDFRFGTRVL
jgi:cell wall-associated NlpC family hydrolase